MGNEVQPVHYDPKNLKILSNDLVTQSLLGAGKGLLIAGSTALLLNRFSPLFRNARIQVKTFYYVAWISYSSYFQADSHLLTFQSNVFKDEVKRRQKALDDAAEKGIFLEEKDVIQSTIMKK
ncbi:hypothetical protein TPHA_0C04410 [Tetrapisispora phaffii CBS 4417]|uniref:Uncharacterized protein n=1 Tax=Tetrapisispora phaffii (strain ATCC 24235 / CBS 4417 / NBRC 1672 / NRRL Y-8282 / UCD 70-5) TaxID=1071381 RepID=G8BQS9_TETPH|nr:hypothetical protein TPHA_0C04410 [Tetrapisispora phaffii CBS 4417]CCE62591.1 hypothetical protein TPHA_0C04410 [Tetrapisispora phaffii CBS 4417]